MFSTRYDETENIWYGPDIAPLYNPNINLAHALLHSMSMFGSKVAQVHVKINKSEPISITKKKNIRIT